MGQSFATLCARVAICAVPLVGLCAQTAYAGGFEVPDNGAQSVGRGNAFTAKADDLTAIAHNPGALIKSKGANILYSHNLIHAPQTFTRQVSNMPSKPLPNLPDGTKADPFATQSNQTPWSLINGMLVGSYDFGLENWTFAAGVYGPSAAGHQEWDVNGGQRWMLTKMDAIMLFYSMAVAYGVPDKFGIGITGQIVHQPSTSLSLVVDGDNGSALAPYYKGAEIESTLKLSAPPTFSAIVGGWWRPVENIEIGASGRVIPVTLNGKGDFTIVDTPTGAKFTDAQLKVLGSSAALQLVLPATAHIGIRYRGLDKRGNLPSDVQLAEGAQLSEDNTSTAKAGVIQPPIERWDIELDFAYEAWSMLKDFNVNLDGQIQLFAKADAQDVTVAKRWKDTYSLRLGGSYNLPNVPVGFMAGTFAETGAVPQNYQNLDFPSYNRLGLNAGVKVKAGPVDIIAAYSHVFQETQTVDETYAKVFQQRPVAPCPGGCNGYDGVPANAGVFTSSFDIISASAAIKF
jgi:long-subunit fatty acid transport protein